MSLNQIIKILKHLRRKHAAIAECFLPRGVNQDDKITRRAAVI
jgi:hypothetical protein